ncbi:M50 family metallopeptidase [Phormidium yuhuli AB48]|uniref:M50 family metallopeptidase n=1 Tax=Phormidium yuhuli AB48 TaxID=2940671 RepID=A0ABY5ARE9_9CYAN|nr:M50 family metallopeptidase [Phormidium yuhuli]USR91417.1 M50 family metallopeptidase [Phormidium yuhuli AB48]
MVTSSRTNGPPQPEIAPDWICPDLRPYWQLAKVKQDTRVVLRCPQTGQRHVFSEWEGFALRYFQGHYTVENVQQRCQAEFSLVDSQLVCHLIRKLIHKGILACEQIPPGNGPRLKSCVQWIEHPDGYWILRNPEDGTYLQVSRRDQAAIAAQVGNGPPSPRPISPQKWQQLLQMLGSTGMLEGTERQKPPKGKFNPLQLLFFKIPLINPDRWLDRHINKLRWIWTKPVSLLLLAVLSASLVTGIAQSPAILQLGTQLWSQHRAAILIPFILLAMLVVSIHELGHAFTLKHYGGVVPEIGLLFMCLFPAAYTNTSDSYCLSRWKRVQVVAAGVLTQILIAAMALWLWILAVPRSSLYIGSYLLMLAALFTIALNLNPLAKFDGYHLAVAATGINNLRSRSFKFYQRLFQGKPRRETAADAKVLALYAPLSLFYICSVFGFLFLRLSHWTLTNIPAIALFVITIWAIYYFLLPENS